MIQSQSSTVLVVGATGQTGRHVVAAATRQGLNVRALIRDADRAREVLPDVTATEIVIGDLSDPDTLKDAVVGVDAVIFAHGANSYGDDEVFQRVDYGGVANVLRALQGRPVRVALMTSINVTRPDNGTYQGLLDWKRRSERLLRASGLPYTIVRPGWFQSGRGSDGLILRQGDGGSGSVSREQTADVLVRSLVSDAAVGKTFELFAADGPAPADWDALFATTDPDTPGGLDAVHNRATLPLDREPRLVTGDIEQLRHR
jgi:uncharacterized protein YbjT (DUF2867 family)